MDKKRIITVGGTGQDSMVLESDLLKQYAVATGELHSARDFACATIALHGHCAAIAVNCIKLIQYEPGLYFEQIIAKVAADLKIFP